MNHEAKKIWIDALRSGEYKQGGGALCSMSASGIKEFCCLGVLVDCCLRVKLDVGQWLEQEGQLPHRCVYKTPSAWNIGNLPREKNFREWIGRISDEDEFTLIKMNDIQKWDFNQIANWIEEKL